MRFNKIIVAASVIAALSVFSFSNSQEPPPEAPPRVPPKATKAGFDIDRVLVDNEGFEIQLMAGLVPKGKVGNVEVVRMDIQRDGASVMARRLSPPDAPLPLGELTRRRPILSRWDTAALRVGEQYQFVMEVVSDAGNFTVRQNFKVPSQKARDKVPVPDFKPTDSSFLRWFGPSTAHAQVSRELMLRANVAVKVEKGLWNYSIDNEEAKSSKFIVRAMQLQMLTPVKVISQPKGWSHEILSDGVIFRANEDLKAAVQPGSSLGGFSIMPLNSTTDSMSIKVQLGSGAGKVLIDYTEGPRP